MAVYCLLSASSSPGVTSTALGLALSWPGGRSILVDADPTGGSPIAAGYLRGQYVFPESLIDLAISLQDGMLNAATVGQHLVTLAGSQARFLPGIRSHEQARGLVSLWEPLGEALREIGNSGYEVVVDAGRAGLFGHAQPLVDRADLTLLVVRPSLVALSSARSWADTLRERFVRAGGARSLGVLLVGNKGYSAREVAQVLGLPVVAQLAWDPAAAAVLSDGADLKGSGLQRLAGRSGWDDSALLRSLRAAGSAMTGTARSALELAGRRV